MDLAATLEAVERATGYRPRQSGKGFKGRCPAHDDNTPSLSIWTADTGKVLLKCHAGCDSKDVRSALGMENGTARNSRSKVNGNGKAARTIVALYDYRDPAGELLYQVVRYTPKAFKQRRPDPDKPGVWHWSMKNVERVLYRLPEVIAAVKAGETIFIVEGEEDADNLFEAELVATTWAGGAKARGFRWLSQYSTALKGARVCLLPDHDPPGLSTMRIIARTLSPVCQEVKLLELPGLAEKEDVSEYLGKHGGSVEDLRALHAAAPVWVAERADDGMNMTGKSSGKIIHVVNMADVTPQRVEWLWRGRIPLGKVCVLDGDPGLGKSTITLDMAARTSTGRRFPFDDVGRPPAGVVLASAEDGLADTIRPRLEAAQAELSRIVAITGVPDSEGGERPLCIPGDLPLVESAIDQVEAALVVIDPLMAFLSGGIDAHRDQDVRRALHALSELANRTGAAIVIVRHLNKSGGSNPVYRGGGSIGIIGASRMGLLVAKHPEDEDLFVLAATKSNVGVMPPSLLYRIRVDETRDVSRIEWEDATDLKANDLLQEAQQSKSPALSEAMEFLRDILAEGPKAVVWIKEQAKEDGIEARTLKRAKRELCVISKQRGCPGNPAGWDWILPEGGQGVPKGAKQNGWPPSEKDRPLRILEERGQEVFEF